MVSPNELGEVFNNKWFSSLGGMGEYMGIIVWSIVSFAVLYIIFVLIEHRQKVTIYPLHGATPEQVKKVQGKEQLTPDQLSEYGLELGRPRTAKGKDVKRKGILQYSILFMPNVFKPKLLPPIPTNLRYFDGVYLLKLDKNTYIPMQKPVLDGDGVNIKVPDYEMDLWEQVEQAHLRQRTQDGEFMKKQLTMTVFIIIGAFVLAGVIIWLSMSFAGKSIDNALVSVKPIADSLQQIAGARGP